MVAAPSSVVAHTKCPTCHARLRIQPSMPDGASVRCGGCRSSFRYFREVKTVARKEINCPRCSLRFAAAISESAKIACPGCQARISIRKTSRARLPMDGGAPLDQTPAPRKAAMANFAAASFSQASRQTRLHEDQAPKTTRLVSSSVNKTQLATGPAQQPPPRPAPPRPAQPPKVPVSSFGWVQKSTRKKAPSPPSSLISAKKFVMIAAALFVVGAIPVWSLCFGEVKRETVHGTVISEGKPVMSGRVVLQGEDGVSLSGAIKPDGSYSIDNVPRGKVRVAVQSADPSLAPGFNEQELTAEQQTIAEGWFPLPDNVGDLNRSGLSVVVEGETTNNIDLK